MVLSLDPLEVASSALRLASVEDAVVDVRREVVRTGPSLARWRGEAAAEFRGRSAALLAGLPSVAQAYGEASSVVLRYARELEDCQAEARRAVALAAEADRLSASAPLVGPDPGAGLRAQAERLRASAEEAHRAAEHRAVSALRDLAGSAPRPRHAAGFERFWSDFTGSAREQLVAPFLLAGMALEAAGGNRAARDDLAAGVAQSWRVWEPVVQVWQQVEDGRGGVALGGALALGATRGLARPNVPRSPEHLRIRDLQDAWDQALAERAKWERVGAMLRGEVDLAYHESLGGHTLEFHAGGPEEFLMLRLRSEAADEPDALRSAFRDADIAQRLVAEVLASPEHRALIIAFAASSRAKGLRLESPCTDQGAGVIVGHDGLARPIGAVSVVLRKDASGTPYVRTAMLEAA